MSVVSAIRAGVENLLFNCIEAKHGDSIAIISEDDVDYIPRVLQKILQLSCVLIPLIRVLSV